MEFNYGTLLLGVYQLRCANPILPLIIILRECGKRPRDKC